MRSSKGRISLTAALVGVAVFSLALANFATGASNATPVGAGKPSKTKSVCGMGTGKKAKGTPIKIGSLNMLIPGVDFTTMAKVAQAYFDCVNDNGGIRGRPIKYIWYEENLDPAQQRSLARKLVESDKVIGIVGNTSFTECSTNWRYYKNKGYVVIGAGVQGACYGVPNIVETNAGPRYSAIAAAQLLVKRGAKSLVIASPDGVASYSDPGVGKVAKAAGIPFKSFPTKLPVTDANAALLQLLQAAGNGGGVILNFTPDTAPAYMKAAIAQKAIDKVIWGSTTPIADNSMAKEFPQFDNKMFIGQEFNLLNSSVGPDTRLMLAVLKKYTKISPQAFAQMGFLAGKFATTALLNVKGAVTKVKYNKAVRGLKNQKTDILCKPWYVGNALPYHIPNNAIRGATYKNGNVVQSDKCFNIQAVDPELVKTRGWEKKFKLNTAK
jgi:branched-chain amino acid transport system substrate-binding protein